MVIYDVVHDTVQAAAGCECVWCLTLTWRGIQCVIRCGIQWSTVGDNLTLTLLVYVLRQPTPACAATRCGILCGMRLVAIQCGAVRCECGTQRHCVWWHGHTRTVVERTPCYASVAHCTVLSRNHRNRTARCTTIAHATIRPSAPQNRQNVEFIASNKLTETIESSLNKNHTGTSSYIAGITVSFTVAF